MRLENNQIAITDKIAKQIFGTESPIGKQFIFPNTNNTKTVSYTHLVKDLYLLLGCKYLVVLGSAFAVSIPLSCYLIYQYTKALVIKACLLYTSYFIFKRRVESLHHVIVSKSVCQPSQ